MELQKIPYVKGKAVPHMRGTLREVFAAKRFGLGVLVLVLLWTTPVALVGCCCKHVQQGDGPVPVPVKSERLELRFPMNVERAASLIACLVRTGSPRYNCSEPSTPICDVRTQEEVAAEYRAVLTKLKGFKLESPFSFSDTLRKLIGEEATETLNIADARRQGPCGDWSQKKACGAFRYKGLWFVVKREGRLPGSIQQMDVFLADMPCRKEVSDAKSR